jgi:hypothetical protein
MALVPVAPRRCWELWQQPALGASVATECDVIIRFILRVTEKKRDLNQPGEVVVHAVGMTIDDNSFEPILGTSTIIIQA